MNNQQNLHVTVQGTIHHMDQVEYYGQNNTPKRKIVILCQDTKAGNQQTFLNHIPVELKGKAVDFSQQLQLGMPVTASGAITGREMQYPDGTKWYTTINIWNISSPAIQQPVQQQYNQVPAPVYQQQPLQPQQQQFAQGTAMAPPNHGQMQQQPPSNDNPNTGAYPTAPTPHQATAQVPGQPFPQPVPQQVYDPNNPMDTIPF